MKGQLYRRGAVPMAALLVAVLCLTAALPAQASERRATDLASVKVFPGGIDLAPRVRYERAILTVSGMGRTFTREFDSHSQPTIGPFDSKGQLLIDGVYRWELQLVPDARTAAGMRESAAANGGVAKRPWLPTSGSFAVLGGILATPDVRERESGRTAEARPGRSVDRPDRQVGGQVYTASKASRGDAGDTDASALGAAGGLKADRVERSSSRRVRSDAPSTQTGLDSDREAAERGVSAEPVLRMVPKAHEIQHSTPRPRSDGANGRPRSDR